MSLRASVGILLRTTDTATDTTSTGTANTTTEAVATIEALSLGNLIVAVVALRLSLSLRLTLRSILRRSIAVRRHANVLGSIWLVRGLGGVRRTRSSVVGWSVTARTGLATQTHKALHATLSSTSIQLLAILSRTDTDTSLAQSQTMRVLVLRVVSMGVVVVASLLV